MAKGDPRLVQFMMKLDRDELEALSCAIERDHERLRAMSRREGSPVDLRPGSAFLRAREAVNASLRDAWLAND